jgi:hypothetical protein
VAALRCGCVGVGVAADPDHVGAPSLGYAGVGVCIGVITMILTLLGVLYSEGVIGFGS